MISRPAAAPAKSRSARVPDGQRVYAIGDVHGRLDLFTKLIDAVEADDDRRDPGQTTIILLGDLVDRGPDSAGVLRHARELQHRRDVRILCGNHEEMMLRSLRDLETLRFFLRPGCGGAETLRSFGLDRRLMEGLDLDQVQQLARELIPQSEVAFIEGFEDCIAIGDYLFAHAGILPGVPLEDQQSSDLRWIREPFLSCEESFGVVVVHGHTIRPEPEVRTNRIGIDTGAYNSGRLTALRLEGTERHFIEALEDEGGAIHVNHRPVEITPGGL